MISRTSEIEQSPDDGPQAIQCDKDERMRGQYSPETLGKVLSALHQDGLVLLKDIIDIGHIEAINTAMCAEVESIKANPTKGYNHGLKCTSLIYQFGYHRLKTDRRQANFLQRPPVANKDLLYEDVYFNSFLLQVANA